MEQPLVSVITITRNRARLIGRCVQSVLNQTYKNIEHIVVDGASDDETDEVIAEFKDERLKFIKLEKNEPIVDTINIGFRASQGRYITFLDSDDEYVPEKIQKQLNLIQSLPEDYGMVYCWMTYYDNVTKKELRIHKHELRGFVASEVVETPTVSGTPTYFFRRNVFEELGGWRSDIGIISDWELAARCCQKWKVDYVPESLVKVYINHGAQRMSEKGFYKKAEEKQLIFEKHFLETFSNIYDQFPQKKTIHLYNICSCYFRLRKWRLAKPYYMELLKLKPIPKNFILPFYCLFHKAR